ncbi:TfoX/Sxy family protein [uncultured Friedmanniella sp.]|uniref:TfoX/Sxy family protein n=1 Tax=uncultured Friedmanniella sp. TaxID=335381 RepID=UPI0035CBF632
MAFDTELADRLRARLSAQPGVSEKRMFGGLAFLVDGHLAVAAGNHGGLLLRADPAVLTELLEDPRISTSVMGDRTMRGWLHVEADESVSDDDLHGWVDGAAAYARSLPARRR